MVDFDAGAAPFVVWEGSQELMRSAFAERFAGIDTARWGEQDITDTYHAVREQAFARCQRVDERHPAHVSGAELLMVTGGLGCLHAWFFHGCRWDQGWAGFGNRIHRADFKRLARIGPPIELLSRETKTRVGDRRIVIRFEFDFRQAGETVYAAEQSAMFVKGRPLA